MTHGVTNMVPLRRGRKQPTSILDALRVPLRGFGLHWFGSLLLTSLLLTVLAPISACSPFYVGMLIWAFLWMIWLHGLLRFSSSCLSGTANGGREPDFGPEWGDVGKDWALSGLSLMVYWLIAAWLMGDFLHNGRNLFGLIVVLMWWPFGFSVATIRGNGWSFWDLQAAFGLITKKPAEVLLAGFIGGCASVLGSLAHAGLSQLPGTGGFIALFAGSAPLIYGMAATGALLGRVIHDDPSVVESV